MIITYSNYFQLPKLGINSQCINFTNVTMESDKSIVVREQVGDSNQVVIIDVNNPNEIMRRPITADSVIMHPTRKIIALKCKIYFLECKITYYKCYLDVISAARQLQMFDIDQKTKIKSHLNSEDVVFWTWINESTVGLVTETSVYHWYLEGM